MKTAIVAVAAVILSVGACAGGDDDTPKSLTGVITEVEAKGLTKVERFTLSVEGQRYEIWLADDVALGFPPAHLNEHKTTGDPVVVDLEERDGRLYATSIQDAESETT